MADEEWVSQDEFGRMLGHRDGRSLASWRVRGAPRSHPVPPPDDYRIERGHARPVWRRATVEAYVRERPGQGRRSTAS